jgi:Homeodomain-like domain
MTTMVSLILDQNMSKSDGRYLSQPVQEYLRQQAVRLRAENKAMAEIADFLGVHRNTVSRWCQIYAELGASDKSVRQLSHRTTNLDQHPIGIAHIGHRLAPGFRRWCHERDRPCRHRLRKCRSHIIGGKTNFDPGGWIGPVS